MVRAQGGSAQEIAAKLDARITPSQIRLWSTGGPKDWAQESYQMAKADAYRLPTRPTCEGGGLVSNERQKVAPTRFC